MKPILLIITLLALAVAGGFIWLRYIADRPLDKVGAVKIAASLTISPSLVWIAQDHGLFAKAGLEATVKECATGKTCADAMIAGQTDLAAAAEFVAISLAFDNPDLRILGTTAFVHTIKLLGLKDKGIASIPDLAGKRVGVKLGTNGEYFLARLLTFNSMKREDIVWVDLKPQLMAEALFAGEVDAVLTWPPFTNKIRGQFGARLVEFDGQPGQDYYYVMMGRQEWLAKNPKIAERVMQALIWAEEWVAANPEKTRLYMVSKFGLLLTDMDEDLQNSRFNVSLPQALPSALELESRWLVEQGSKGTPPANSLDLITFEPLTAVAPAAVTMIRGTPAH